MMNLDNLEEAVLSQARGESILSSGQRAAKWAAIESRIALGELPVVDLPSPANGLLGAASPLQTLIIGLAMGGAVGLGVGVLQNVKPSEPAPTNVAPSTVPEAREVIPPRPPEALPELKPSSAQEIDSEARVPTVVLSPNSRKSADEEAASAPKPMSFHEELAYLQRAQAALHRGQPAMALGLMLSLEEMQEAGALLSERQLTQVLALCALGRPEEAKVVGARLMSQSGSSLYAERLRRSCASPDDAISDGAVSDDSATPDNSAASDDREVLNKNSLSTNGSGTE